jgi:outer membrane biosynthesis protein TonB
VRLRPLILPAALLGVLGVLLLPALAQAQESIDPTATPTEFTGGWVYAMAVGMTVLGAVIAVLVVVSYMRFAPRFQKGDQHTVRAERIVEGREPPRRQVEVRETEPVLVAAPVAQAAAPVATAPPKAAAPPAAAPPAAAPKPAPAPAAAPAAAEKPAEQPAAAPAAESKPVEAAPPAAAATAPPASAPAAASHGGAEQDQETYDRVLAEQLSKGVDRRVAEGRAKSAAVVAARKKAGG